MKKIEEGSRKHLNFERRIFDHLVTACSDVQIMYSKQKT